MFSLFFFLKERYFKDSNLSLGNNELVQPLRDDASPSQVGALNAEAAVLQRFW